MSPLKRLCLVLNSSYEAIAIIEAKHAFKLVFKYSASVVENSDYKVHTPSLDVPVPDIIRLVNYRRVPRKKRAVSRRGIIMRDNGQCQYCGLFFPSEDLTMDHVLPKSRGGQFDWSNIVTACLDCNGRKDNRTPEEAGMKLIHKPIPLSIHSHGKGMSADHKKWSIYLFH